MTSPLRRMDCVWRRTGGPTGGWHDYDAMTVAQAEGKVTDARDALNALHKVQAVSEVDAQRAKQAESDIPVLQHRMEELAAKRAAKWEEREVLNLAMAGHKREYDDLEIQLVDLRAAVYKKHECPHCHGALSIHNGNIVVAEDNADAALQISQLEDDQHEIYVKHNELQDKAKPLTLRLAEFDREFSGVQVALANAIRNARNIGEVETEEQRSHLASAEQGVEDAKVVVRLVKAESDAASLHETIARYTEVARALGPEGVRAKMLTKGLKKLNGGLVSIAAESGWPSTTVTDNGGVFIGDRPIALCSESERFRCQLSIQLTLAAITGSQVAVIDRGDILDPNNRDGLAKVLNRVAKRTGMAILLCSTGNINGTSPWAQVAIREGAIVV